MLTNITPAPRPVASRIATMASLEISNF